MILPYLLAGLGGPCRAMRCFGRRFTRPKQQTSPRALRRGPGTSSLIQTQAGKPRHHCRSQRPHSCLLRTLWTPKKVAESQIQSIGPEGNSAAQRCRSLHFPDSQVLREGSLGAEKTSRDSPLHSALASALRRHQDGFGRA